MSKEQKKKKPSWNADDFIQPSGEKVKETVASPKIKEKSVKNPAPAERIVPVYYYISWSLRTRIRVHCAGIGRSMSDFIAEAITDLLDRKESAVQPSGEKITETVTPRYGEGKTVRVPVSAKSIVSVRYNINESLRTRLRVYCARMGRSMRDFIAEAIPALLDREEASSSIKIP